MPVNHMFTIYSPNSGSPKYIVRGDDEMSVRLRSCWDRFCKDVKTNYKAPRTWRGEGKNLPVKQLRLALEKYGASLHKAPVDMYGSMYNTRWLEFSDEGLTAFLLTYTE